jgi:hypothetical protein
MTTTRSALIESKRQTWVALQNASLIIFRFFGFVLPKLLSEEPMPAGVLRVRQEYRDQSMRTCDACLALIQFEARHHQSCPDLGRGKTKNFLYQVEHARIVPLLQRI